MFWLKTKMEDKFPLRKRNVGAPSISSVEKQSISTKDRSMLKGTRTDKQPIIRV